MDFLAAAMAVAAALLLGVSIRDYARRRPVAEPPPGIEERREPRQLAGIADTHKAAMALVSAVALGFMAAATLSGYVGLPQRVGLMEARQATWEQERIIQRVGDLEGRMAAVEETTRYQTCRARQIDRGLDPSGCAAWLENPDEYEPSRAGRDPYGGGE